MCFGLDLTTVTRDNEGLTARLVVENIVPVYYCYHSAPPESRGGGGGGYSSPCDITGELAISQPTP